MFATLYGYRTLRRERMVVHMIRSLPRALFAASALFAISATVDVSPALAQSQTTYDVKTINFDLWCQEQANLPPDRCDKRLPADEQLTGVGLVDAGQDLHQGGLAGPVLAEQSVCLPGVQHHRPVGQGLGGTERLGGVPQLKDGLTLRGVRRWLGRCPGLFH